MGPAGIRKPVIGPSCHHDHHHHHHHHHCHRHHCHMTITTIITTTEGAGEVGRQRPSRSFSSVSASSTGLSRELPAHLLHSLQVLPRYLMDTVSSTCPKLNCPLPIPQLVLPPVLPSHLLLPRRVNALSFIDPSNDTDKAWSRGDTQYMFAE